MQGRPVDRVYFHPAITVLRFISYFMSGPEGPVVLTANYFIRSIHDKSQFLIRCFSHFLPIHLVERIRIRMTVNDRSQRTVHAPRAALKSDIRAPEGPDIMRW